MLDETTKRNINAARDVLVGKVPDPKQQVEQITTALIYKFMDDLDKEAIELGGKAKYFAGKYAEFAWTNVLDTRHTGEKRLDLYVRAITSISKNPSLPQLFRDIFKGAFLPYNDSQTLSLFLKEINKFTYGHSEELGNAYEYLLSVLGSQGDAGQFRTPRHIIDFIVAVVDPKKTDRILDPACGTAGFLISAFKHIQKHNSSNFDADTPVQASTGETAGTAISVLDTNTYPGDLLIPAERKKLTQNIQGYDISPEMVRLSLVNLYLHGFSGPQIHEYDALTSEKRWDESFDVILANPPFMTPKGGIRPHGRFQVQANRSEVLFVNYIMEHLNFKGRAGIIVPEGVVFKSNKAYKQLRQLLVEDGLFAVVSLPAGVFNPYSGVKTSILFFDNEVAKLSDEILFVKIENDGYDLGAQRRRINRDDLHEAQAVLQAWKHGKKRKSGLALWVNKVQIGKNGEYKLTTEGYVGIKRPTKSNVPLIPLDEISELVRGITYSRSDEVSDDGYKILRANNVSLDGRLVFDEVKQIKKSLKLQGSRRLAEDDILICLASGSKAHVGKVAFIETDIDFYFGSFMGALRVNRTRALPKYVFYLLRSRSFNDYLRSAISGASINNLNAKILGSYQIPLPSLETQREIVEQLEVKQKAIEAAKSVIESLERERELILVTNLEN